MSTTVDQLVVEVQSNSTSAVSGIDALASSLGKLKTALRGGIGLASVSKNLTTMNTALTGISSNVGTLDRLASSLASLSSLGGLKLSSTIATQITNIGAATRSLNGTEFGAIKSLTDALTPLQALGRSNLGSFVSQLKKLPEVMTALNSVDMGALAAKIRELANALAPLGTQLQAVSNGFSNLPTKVKQLSNNLNQLERSNQKASKNSSGFGGNLMALAGKFTIVFMAVQRVAQAIGGWITKSTQYVENLNLFTVSMGQYASEAQKFAESVGEIMGIDPGEWMRNQGIFMTLATGFGVMGDRASVMSQNLTQLGYDISSFFNISYEDAFQKLQSGLAGELEPLRRLGYDLSVARLQQEAYTLGIDKKVTAMTQAEKAELRYYTIMTQVTTAQGDMARTLEAPANQLRILKAQVEQCGRALGNIFIPMLNAILPYAIAVVKAIRMIANEIANLFGFALPSIDYSGLSSASGSAEDLAGGLGGAAGKAKELKNALLGIDELNVISPPEDSGGGAGGIGGAGGLDFELPTYDFLGEAVSGRIEEIFGKFKTKWEEFKQQVRESGVVDAFNRLKEAVAGLGDSALVEKIKEIFGVFSDQSTVGTLNLVRDLLNFIADIINGDLNSGINDFKELVLDIHFDPLIVIASIIDTICGTDLAGWLSSVKEELSNLDLTKFNGFEKLADGIEDLKQGFAKLKEGIKKVGDALRESGVADAIKDFVVWLVKTKVDVIMFDIGTALGIVGDALALIGDLLSGDFDEALNDLKNLLVGFSFAPFERLALIIDAITGADVSGTVMDIENAIKNFDLGQWVSDVGDSIKRFITKTLPDAYNDVKKSIKKFLTETLPSFFTTTLPDLFESIWNEVVTYFTETLPNDLSERASKYTEVGEALWEGLKEGWNSGVLKIKEFVQGFIQKFKEALGIHSPSTVFKEIGGDVIAGFLQGIGNFTSISTTVKGWATNIVEWFTKGNDGKNVIDRFKEIGGNIIGGFRDKILVSNSDSKSSMTTWATNVKEWFSSSSYGGANGTSFGSFATNVISGFKEKIYSGHGDSKTSITTWANNVKTWFSNGSYGGVNGTSFETYAKDIINGFRNKITSAHGDAKSSITTWATNVKTWFTGIASSTSFGAVAKDLIDGFKNKIAATYTDAKSNVQTFGTEVKNWFTGKVSYSTFYSAARDVIEGFKNGIGNLYTTCKNTITSWGSSIINWFKSKLGIHSPSTVFFDMAGYSIEGFNNGFASLGKSTRSVVSSWADSFTNVSPTMGFAVDTSALKYYDSNSFARSVSATVSTNSSVTATGFVEGMEEFYREYVQPTMAQMAADMRRQADKPEQTIVQIGNRTVSDAVTTQQRANGYVFAR